MLKKMRIKRRIVKRESDSPTFKICNGSQALEVKLPGVIYDTGESLTIYTVPLKRECYKNQCLL